MVNRIRRTYREGETRLFTYNNNSLNLPNLYSNDGVHLNEHGTKKLMLKLKDGIMKALRMERPNSQYLKRNNSYDE